MNSSWLSAYLYLVMGVEAYKYSEGSETALSRRLLLREMSSLTLSNTWRSFAIYTAVSNKWLKDANTTGHA